LAATDVILLAHFNTELQNGVYHTYNQISKALGAESSAPIFVLWNFYVRNGVFGGYVNHSERLGELALETLNKQLSIGFIDEDKPDSSYRPVFDFNALTKHKIDPERLPDNALLINRPVSLWDRHKSALIFIAAAFLFLIAVIIVQGARIRHKQTIAKHTNKILALKNKTLNVQKEMILMLGDAIETRSGETGNHVKRVAKMSAFLGQLYGLTPRQVEMMEIVSPMHDVGKIAISEKILEKPGKLTADEWDVMKTHTTIGHKMLCKSEGELFTLAGFVAHEHHERWDGSGYPRGLNGEDIHVFARLTALVDVFDALLSKRCYKKPWLIEDVIALIRDESGKQFDPEMTALLLSNVDEFLEIRERYPDDESDKKP
jgi:HD-GYP domain-containing protein (c-di-GMP phosphodiesterase class II)